MSYTKLLIAAAFLGAVIAGTSACTTGRAQPTPTPPPSVPSASSPSTTTTTTTTTTTSSAPPTLSPAAQDLKDAEQTVPRFWTVLDTLASDPKTSLDELATVSRDQAIGQWRSILTGYRERGWKKVGRSTVASVEATTADGKTFAVSACIDVSKANLVDSAGKSVVTAGRLDRTQYNYQVQKAPQGFFVTEDKLEVKPC